MNSIYRPLLFVSFVLALFSCDDEFINEKTGVTGVATSAIIISPEWESDNYQFQCEDIGNADFVIESKPDWLVTENMSGSFSNNMATITAKAKIDSRYSATGIYIDQMIIVSGNSTYAVPVYYITEGNPKIEINQNFEINHYNYITQLQITNSGDGILLWDILSLPEWLMIDIDQFSPTSLMLGKNDVVNVPFMLDMASIKQNELNGSIVLISNDKNTPRVEINVSAKLGTPNLGYFNSTIDFGTTNTQYINFSNSGEGILTWSFEQIPDWLTVSPSSGITMPYTSSEIVLTYNSEELASGLHATNILLQSNDPQMPSIEIPIKLRVPGLSDNIKPIEGNIVDIKMQKSTNQLYYTTALPNKFVVYDVSSKEIVNEISLDKSPTCMAISDDFSKALIGHGGLISVLDLNDFTVTKTTETNFMMYSAAWTNNDWYCYTKTDNNDGILFWINTDSDETYETTTNWTFNTADLTKVPNQPYVIGSRKDVSPTGIFLFNTNTKTMEAYSHSSIGKLYFFDEGELVITQYSGIMRTSVLTSGADPSYIGELKTEEYARPSWWIDFSPVNNSIWALFSYYTHSYYPPEDATIYQFEDNDYSLVKRYTYDNQFQANETTTPYEVIAHYVFANNEGTELSVLRKGKDNNNWSIEFLPIIQ